MIKTILKRGFRLVRLALNSTKHGHFLFEFLPIGREEQDGDVVRFAERRVGEGLVSILEVWIAMAESLRSTSRTVNMLVEFWQPNPQICFVKIPSYNKCSLRICGPVKFFEARRGFGLSLDVNSPGDDRGEFSRAIMWSAFNCELFYTPLPFCFPERYLFARCTENPAGFTDSNRVSRESYGSVKQSMLQAPMSLWKEILARSASTLLSKDISE